LLTVASKGAQSTLKRGASLDFGRFQTHIVTPMKQISELLPRGENCSFFTLRLHA